MILMRKSLYFLLLSLGFAGIYACSKNSAKQPQYEDKPFMQDFSVKYYSDTITAHLLQAFSDRNGAIKVFSKEGMLHTYDGKFQYPGSLDPDKSYRFLTDKKIAAIGLYDQQIVYLSDSVVFSNAWA